MMVTKTRTIVRLEQLVAAVLRVWPEAEDVDLAILWGKLISECGWPDTPMACWNFNIGNIRGTAPDGGFTLLAGAWELCDVGKLPAGATPIDAPPGAYVPPGKMAYLLPVESQKFRAYASLEDAVADYLDTMQRRFKAAHAELVAPNSDPTRFVLALKAGAYFTGDPGQYVTNVGSGYRWALSRIPAVRAALEPAPDLEPSPFAVNQRTEQPTETPQAIDFVATLSKDIDT